MKHETLSRREFLASAAAVGATIILPAELTAAADGKKTFTILHTNDMHSAFIGMGPASDYTPFTLNDDATRGGYARLPTTAKTPSSSTRWSSIPASASQSKTNSMNGRTGSTRSTTTKKSGRSNPLWLPRGRDAVVSEMTGTRVRL